MSSHDSTALQVYDDEQRLALSLSVVRPLVTPAEAKQAAADYEALKSAIVRPDDIQLYQGRKFLKKAFWRRIAAFFGLSLEAVSEFKGYDEDGRLFYSVIERAIAPNGRSMTGDGYCSQAEKGHEAWPEHTVRAVAHTRAKNRAISDLIGGGEVSAEEMEAGNYVDAAPPARTQQRQLPPAGDDRGRTANKPATQRSAAPVAPAAYTQAGASGMTRAEFIAKAGALGFSPKAAMDELGVKSLSELDLAAAIKTLEELGTVDAEVAPNFSPPQSSNVDDDDISFQIEEGVEDSPEQQQPVDEPWQYLGDRDFRTLCNKAKFRTIADVEALVDRVDGPEPRRSVLMGYLTKMLDKQQNIPDLATVNTGTNA